MTTNLSRVLQEFGEKEIITFFDFAWIEFGWHC